MPEEKGKGWGLAMNTTGKLSYLKKVVINIDKEDIWQEQLIESITSDRMFMASGLQIQRDYTGQIRLCFMNRCWGKSALTVFFGITYDELDYIVNAQRKNAIIKRVDEIIQKYSEYGEDPDITPAAPPFLQSPKHHHSEYQ